MPDPRPIPPPPSMQAHSASPTDVAPRKKKGTAKIQPKGSTQVGDVKAGDILYSDGGNQNVHSVSRDGDSVIINTVVGNSAPVPNKYGPNDSGNRKGD